MRLDLDAAALARAAHPDERDRLLAGRDQALRFIAEVPEHVPRIAPELANPAMAPVGAAARAGDDPRVPNDLRVEQLLRPVEVTAVERLVSREHGPEPGVIQGGERLVDRAGAPPPDGPAVLDRPDVHNARLDLDPAAMASAVLPGDHDHPVAALNQLLGLDVKVVEALEPRFDEPLETLRTMMISGFERFTSRSPLDRRVDELEHGAELSAVPGLVAAHESRYVVLGHPCCGSGWRTTGRLVAPTSSSRRTGVV